MARQSKGGKKLGVVLMDMGVVTKEEIGHALLAQEGKSRFTKKMGNILVESGLITYATLEHALESQKSCGKLLGAVLVDMGVLNIEEVIDAQATQNGMLTSGASPSSPREAA